MLQDISKNVNEANHSLNRIRSFMETTRSAYTFQKTLILKEIKQNNKINQRWIVDRQLVFEFSLENKFMRIRNTGKNLLHVCGTIAVVDPKKALRYPDQSILTLNNIMKKNEQTAIGWVDSKFIGIMQQGCIIRRRNKHFHGSIKIYIGLHINNITKSVN